MYALLLKYMVMSFATTFSTQKKDIASYWLGSIIYVWTVEDAPVNASEASFKCFYTVFWPHSHHFGLWFVLLKQSYRLELAVWYCGQSLLEVA